MPRSRGAEAPQRPSPTPRMPRHIRTSSSDSDPLHHRPVTDRTQKPGDRRSPRSEPLNQKRLGTRISDLETQLVQAQHELKSLKNQLASAESAKKEAQDELNNKTIKPKKTKKVEKNKSSTEKPDDDVISDVFEVRMEKATVEIDHPCADDDIDETKSIDEKQGKVEKAPLYEEIDQLKAKVEEKEKEMQIVCQENECLKEKLRQVNLELGLVNGKEEEMREKLAQTGAELEASKANGVELREKLEAVVVSKEALEEEMKRLRVQTEQWRKAADVAATVLSGEAAAVNGGTVSERCGSMEKHYNSVFEPPFGGYWNGYGVDIEDGKRKGSGIKMLGDLWKKKGQK